MRDQDFFNILGRIEEIEDFLDDMMDFRSVLREKKEARTRWQIKENPPPVKEVGLMCFCNNQDGHAPHVAIL